jgi:hypothetical protein
LSLTVISTVKRERERERERERMVERDIEGKRGRDRKWEKRK